MKIGEIITNIENLGYKVHQMYEGPFKEGEYSVVLKNRSIDDDAKNIIEIFNSYNWNVKGVHFYSNDLYVEFSVKFETPIGFDEIGFCYE